MAHLFLRIGTEFIVQIVLDDTFTEVIDLELIQRQLPLNHNLFMFGDTHIGTVLCYYSGIEKLIEMMESPYDGLPPSRNYGIHMGDAIEGILIDDPRFRPDTTETPFPMKQINKFVELMQPIKSRLITVLEGNHEQKLWRFGNLNAMICEKLGVVPGTFSAKITITARNRKRHLYKIFAIHGRKGINSTADSPHRRKSNMGLILQRHLRDKAGDCVLMAKAHVHKLLLLEPENRLYLIDKERRFQQKYTHSEPNEEYIHPDHRWYICTGGFYKMYKLGTNTYVELGEYDPVELGFMVVKVREGKIVGIDKVVV